MECLGNLHLYRNVSLRNSFTHRAKLLIAGAWHDYCKGGVIVQDRIASWALWIDGFNWMNTNDVDLLDHSCILDEFGGDIVLTGLGLGLGVLFAQANQYVTSITVIEKDLRIIDAILPMIQADTEITVIHADADDFRYEDHQFDFAYLDHCNERAPDATIARVKETVPIVRVWFDEYQEALKCL
jgi:hypothetical protein